MPSHDDADIRLRVGFLKHPKTRMLRRKLGGDGVLALLELWLFAGVARPSGDLAGMTNEQIEMAAGWEGAPGALVDALSTLAWIDGSAGAWRLHEWGDYQPWAVARSARREAGRSGGRKSAEARAAKYGTARPNVGTQTANVGTPPGIPPPCVASGFASGDTKQPFGSPNSHPIPTHPSGDISLPSRTSDACARARETPVRGVVALPVESIDFDRRRRAAEALRATVQADARAKAAPKGVS